MLVISRLYFVVLKILNYSLDSEVESLSHYDVCRFISNNKITPFIGKQFGYLRPCPILFLQGVFLYASKMPTSKVHADCCECDYCEYIDLQRSMTGLSRNLSRNRIDKIIPVENVEEEKSVPKPSPFHRQWCCFLLIMRLIGNCPLSYKLVKGRPWITFKWISWSSFYTLLIHILRIVLCVYFYKDWGYYVLGREYGESIPDWIYLAFNLALPFNQIWELIITWVCARRSERVAFCWMCYEFHYVEIFGRQLSFPNSLRTKWRGILVFLCISQAIGFACGFLGEILIARNRKQLSAVHFLRILPLFIFIVVSMLEEFRILLHYFTIAESFRLIKLGIKEQLKHDRQISLPQVNKWTKLIQSLRHIVKLTGHLQAPQQIVYYLYATFILTGLIFLAIEAVMRGQVDVKNLILMAVFGHMIIVRLFVKIVMADDITVAEERLVDFLSGEIGKHLFDFEARLELCSIIHTLQQKPSKICLSGYITIEKRLLPKMIAHVLSYLVILVQFHLGYYFNKGTMQ